MNKVTSNPAASIRLLISARDTGAAAHLCIIAEKGRSLPDFNIHVVTVGAARTVFDQRGISSTHVMDSPEIDWLAYADEVLHKIRPNAVLVGLSGPDRGLDEAIVARACTKHVYAFQDFWGDLNPGFGHLPRTFFVLDDTAAKLTLMQEPSARVFPVGNICLSERLRDLDPLNLRRTGREELGVDPSTPLIGFYGQGHTDCTAYSRMVTALGKAIRDIKPDAHILFRPHPKETPVQRAATIEALGGAIEDTFSDVEQSLATVDLVATWYSTCGVVSSHMSKLSPVPLAPVLYLQPYESMRKWYLKTNHTMMLPLEALAIVVDDESQISAALVQAFNPSERSRIWHACRKALTENRSSPLYVLDRIREDVLADRLV